MRTLSTEIAEAGFAIVPNVIGTEDVARLLAATERASESKSAGRGGIRNLLDRVPEVRALVESLSIRGLVEPILAEHAFAARGICSRRRRKRTGKYRGIRI